MALFSQLEKLYNFEQQTLKLRNTNVFNSYLNCVGCQSSLESSFSTIFLFYVKQTWITQLRFVSRKIWEFLYTLLTGFTSFGVFPLFFCQSLFFFHCSLFTVLCVHFFMLFLQIYSSANVSVFVGFNIHHKDWLIYYGEIETLFPTRTSLLISLVFLLGSHTRFYNSVLLSLFIPIEPSMFYSHFPTFRKFLSCFGFRFHWLLFKYKHGYLFPSHSFRLFFSW